MVSIQWEGIAFHGQDVKQLFTIDQEKLPMFYGNLTDYFKILDQDETTLLIGAR